MVDYKVEACAECTKKCLSIHGEHKSSPRSPSFFKIMIGDRFSQFLPLPPAFAPTVSALVNQKTLLVDSHLQEWEVMISRVDTCIAFQQGWNDFALAHGLQVGDVVWFDYIGSYFAVRIYNTSACEQFNFSGNSPQRKRTRTNSSNSKESPCYTVDKGTMNKRVLRSGSDVDKSRNRGKVNDTGKTPMVTENTLYHEKSYNQADCIEEPFYMIGRNLGDKQGEDASPIIDLSNFEMRDNNSSVAEKNKYAVVAGDERSSQHADTLPRSPVEVALVHKENVSDIVATSNVPDAEMILENNGSGHVHKILNTFDNLSPVEDERSPHQDDTLLSSPVDGYLADIDKENDLDIVALSNALDTEMIWENNDVAVEDERSRNADNMLSSAVEAGLVNKKDKAILVPSNASDIEMICLNNSSEDVGKPPCISNRTSSQIYQRRDNTHSNSLYGNDQVMGFRKKGASLVDCDQSSQQEAAGASVLCTDPISVGAQTFQSVKREHTEIIQREVEEIVKTEPVEITPDIRGYEDMLEETGLKSKILKLEHGQRFNMLVKTETDYSVGLSSPIGPTVFSVVVTRKRPFLELPQRLPSANKKKMYTKRKVVYLRDPFSRLWPAVYHDRLNFKLLSSGWEAFCQANDIQVGDKCAFEVEDVLENIFRVRTVESGWEAFCQANDIQVGDKCAFEVEDVLENIFRVHTVERSFTF